jgi:hypothetical protein
MNTPQSDIKSTTKIAFGGSREFSNRAQVGQVVAAVLRSGAAVSVGCAIGADALVIGAVVGAGGARRLAISAAFGPGGVGAWAGSAVGVVRSACAAGAAVAWWAGGSSSVPLRGRLAARSAAALRQASAAVFFLSGQGTPGSLKTARLAVKRGLQVFAFCAVRPTSVPDCVGAWQPCQFAELPAWQWQPAAIQPSIF